MNLQPWHTTIIRRIFSQNCNATTYVSICDVQTWLLQRTAGRPPIIVAGALHCRRVLHAAVRLQTGLGLSDHILGKMMKIYWLPIENRMKFKLCHIARCSVGPVSGRYPGSRLADIVTRTSAQAWGSSLYRIQRSWYQNSVLRTSFLAGPQHWNELSPDIRSTTDHAAFKRARKLTIFNSIAM